MIYASPQKFDEVPYPEKLTYFNPSKRKFASFVTFDLQVDRDLKKFNREHFIQSQAQSKKNKGKPDNQVALLLENMNKQKQSKGEIQVSNPFIELDKQRFRPK